MADFFVFVADVLGIADIAQPDGSEYNLFAADTLTITDEGFDHEEHTVAATDTLTLTDSSCELQADGDTLVLTESATATMQFNTAVVDPLSLVEVFVNNVDFTTTVEDELVTTEEQFDPDTGLLTDVEVGLLDSAASAGVETGSAGDSIPLTEVANGWIVPLAGAVETASDTITFTESARFTVESDAKDTLGISDEATVDVGRTTEDTLSLSDSASATMDYGNLQASDTLSLNEGMAFLLCELNPGVRPEFKYSPSVGFSSDPDAPTPPPTTYQAAGATAGFRLQYPEVGAVTDELILPNPNFGNKNRLTPQRLNQETPGGTLLVFADPIWPKIETLLFSFSNMKKAQARELQAWFDNYLGQEIRLIDHEDRLWKGIISEVTDPIVHDRRIAWTASFEFEGELV